MFKYEKKGAEKYVLQHILVFFCVRKFGQFKKKRYLCNPQ